MKTTFAVSHVENNPIIVEHFQERVAKIQKHLKKFKDDLTYLHGTLDKNPHKEEFYATLSLYLPSVTLHCRERGEEFGAAINAAFLALVRQIEKHKDKLGREKRRPGR